ncbi:MAG: PAS domain S-box protein [Sphingomonas phyllosphaerae]|uniref:PAS domain S-box protein n=1 Tax=Sphingomonas phyllosphaerae TaxID=257003 RepID=UPI002FF8D89C
MTGQEAQAPPRWPFAETAMAKRIRDFDWSATALGPIAGWPQHLRTVVDFMFDTPGMASLVWGEKAIHLYNDRFTELLREHHVQPLGRSAYETFARSRGAFAADVAAGMAGQSARLPAQRYPVLRNGRLEDAWFDVDYAPVRDEHGAVAGVLWTLKETTTQVLAARALRESEARHRLLIGSWAQAVWETDRDGVVVADSPSWRAFTGQTLEEWLGYGWLDAIHPDDRAYAERQWRDAIAARGLVDAEFRLRAPDGGWRWTNVRAAPVLDADDGIAKWVGINIDIDARKRAETALRESEAKYRSLFESMDDAYAVVDVLRDADGRWSDFRFVEVNPAFLEHTGMPWPIGKTATELLGTPNPHWTRLYGQVLETGRSIRVDESEPTLDRIFDLNIFPLVRERHRVAVLFTNVTEQRRAAAAMRESEEVRRVALDSGRMGAWKWDTRAGTVRTDATVQALWGVSAPEQPHPVSVYADLMFSEGADWLADVAAKDIAPGEDFQVQVQIATGPTAGRWVEIRGRAERERPWIINGVSFDITPRRQVEERVRASEQRLRLLVEGIPQLVWRSADDGRWTWSSLQWQSLTGQSLAASLDRGWLDAVHPDDRDATVRAWHEAATTGGIDVEFRVRRAVDGAYLWHHTRSMPVRDDAGRIVEWLGTTTDVQQRKELQERQTVLVDELQHRTRNLIGVVRSMSDKTARTSADLRDFRARFGARLDALARVQGLLSRLDDVDRVSFDELLRTELSAMSGSLDRVRLEGPMGVRLRSSTVQTLAMALHELATNAVKYGAFRQAGGQLAVIWSLDSHGEGGKPWLHVDWRESGVAMPPDGAAPTGSGQGRDLIERALPYQLRARTSYRLGPDGVHCTISLPVSASTEVPTHA